MLIDLQAERQAVDFSSQPMTVSKEDFTLSIPEASIVAKIHENNFFMEVYYDVSEIT